MIFSSRNSSGYFGSNIFPNKRIIYLFIFLRGGGLISSSNTGKHVWACLKQLCWFSLSNRVLLSLHKLWLFLHLIRGGSTRRVDVCAGDFFPSGERWYFEQTAVDGYDIYVLCIFVVFRDVIPATFGSILLVMSWRCDSKSKLPWLMVHVPGTTSQLSSPCSRRMPPLLSWALVASTSWLIANTW